jgi:ferredoxin
MDVRIHSNLCQGHGVCEMICSEVFKVDDAGYGTVVKPNPDESLAAEVSEAASNCPESAISVTW